MLVIEKFSEWIDHWTAQSNQFLNAWEKLHQLKYSIKKENEEKNKKELDALKKEFSDLIYEFNEKIQQFHSNSQEVGNYDPKIKAAREIVFSASEIIRKVDFGYSCGEENLIIGLRNHLSNVRSALNDHWDSPTTSILGLDLDKVIQKYLFYYNGVATIGQLKQSIKSEVKFSNIGPIRLMKIEKALLSIPNPIENSLPQHQEKPRELEPGSYGVWKLNTKETSEFFIELSPAQALTVANHCSIQILDDGKVLAKLAGC